LLFDYLKKELQGINFRSQNGVISAMTGFWAKSFVDGNCSRLRG
jgi:hypothetical protein